MILARRSFLTGLGAALITAPSIVRAGSLMPVKQMIEPIAFIEKAWLDLLVHMMAGNGEILNMRASQLVRSAAGGDIAGVIVSHDPTTGLHVGDVVSLR